MTVRAPASLLAPPARHPPGATGPEALEDLMNEAMVLLHGAARREGLTLVQLLVLKLLEKRGPLSPSVLAELLGISRPAVTSSINILESGRWVAREHPEGDRRRLAAALRPKAQEVLARLARERRSFIDAGLVRIDARRRAEFAATAAELADHLRAIRSREEGARMKGRFP
jgi:DNA-binding MarR family transcriptional regulator